MGSAGVTDPTDNQPYAGLATNWMLCSAAATCPVFEVASLDGKREPSLRSTRLDRAGNWGWRYDILRDVGARVAGWRGVYFSTGTV